MDMSDDKDSDEWYQISKNDEEKATDVIEVLKLGKLSLQKNIDNAEKYPDKRNRMDMIDDKDSENEVSWVKMMKKQ